MQCLVRAAEASSGLQLGEQPTESAIKELLLGVAKDCFSGGRNSAQDKEIMDCDGPVLAQTDHSLISQ